jgi:hypothetical protein
MSRDIVHVQAWDWYSRLRVQCIASRGAAVQWQEWSSSQFRPVRGGQADGCRAGPAAVRVDVLGDGDVLALERGQRRSSPDLTRQI